VTERRHEYVIRGELVPIIGKPSTIAVLLFWVQGEKEKPIAVAIFESNSSYEREEAIVDRAFQRWLRYGELANVVDEEFRAALIRARNQRNAFLHWSNYEYRFTYHPDHSPTKPLFVFTLSKERITRWVPMDT